MEQPSGVVAFLFTDVEGSTRLWEEYPGPMAAALAAHDRIVERAVADHRGYVFTRAGDGFSAAFGDPSDAVLAIVEIERALAGRDFGAMGPLSVRAALHAGAAEERGGDYFGPALSRCARLLSAAHGGQVVASAAFTERAGELPTGLAWRSLGEHRLKDLRDPEWVAQLIHPDLPAEFPPLRSLTKGLHNLPVQLTEFIGREAEIAEVVERVRSHRLVTLTGVGGVGKTRLGLQAAAELVNDFEDGVWLVELGRLGAPGQLAGAVARALGVRERPPEPIDEVVVEHLRGREALILLDNCEHMIGAAAEAAQRLLQASPGVRVLATSREGLGMPGEAITVVPSLGVPISDDDYAESEAVELFTERARDVDPGFETDAITGPVVAGICRRLDGIPLAIELAAARLRALTVQQVSERLDDRFRLLTGGSRTALPRQRTLAAMMDWSHDLLTAGEQTLFRRLAVFHRGFTLAAAEEVCADGGLDPVDVVDHLTRLVEVSLVMPGWEQEPRYRLLETVRQYAMDRLITSGEAEEVRRRHAEHYMTAGPGSRSGIPDGAYAEWYEFREREYGNYMAALAWAVDGGHVETAKKLVIQLGNYWPAAGALLEGDRWTSRVLAMADREPDHEQMRLLTFAAENAAMLGRVEEADTLAAEVEAVARAIGDEAGLASALGVETGLAEQFGRLADAEEMAHEALEIFRFLGDPRAADRARQLAAIVLEQGRHREAERLLEDLETSLPVRDLDRDGLTLLWGVLAYHRGRYGECLSILDRVGTDVRGSVRLGVDEVGPWRAGALLGLGRITEARAVAEETVPAAHDAGNRRDEAQALVLLARMDLLEGPMVAAAERLVAALEILQLVPHRRVVVLAGLTVAAFEAMRGRLRQAALLLAAADVTTAAAGIALAAPDVTWRADMIVGRLPSVGSPRLGASDAMELVLGWEP